MASYILSVILFIVVLTVVSVAASEDETPFDCPANERYVKCQLAVCIKTCEHLRNMPPCPSIAAGCYKPACVCNHGFLRNLNGVCVRIVDCGFEVPDHMKDY
ncbi:allergen Api m 6-like [Spodoptera litura]|uniref:Allergen Api m 6-like n=1 Tax=Spodoptera litura TaxID=69820 RepID=A0A9J7IV67_SPOLT|nr:allergen Api m 6-like [Spodoptera litura]